MRSYMTTHLILVHCMSKQTEIEGKTERKEDVQQLQRLPTLVVL